MGKLFFWNLTMEIDVYIDESGDLGWKFDAPYRNGGSSRHLTIAGIMITHEKRDLLKRLMRKLYKKSHTPTDKEVKWANLNDDQRLWIAKQLAKFKIKHGNDVHFICISVKKENVEVHIRQDENKLYNYMIKLAFSKKLSEYQFVTLNIDQRSIKVKSGNSLHDYLQTVIWFEHKTQTQLTSNQCNSKDHLNVQLADILSGIVQSHFEDGRSNPFQQIQTHLQITQLFF